MRSPTAAARAHYCYHYRSLLASLGSEQKVAKRISQIALAKRKQLHWIIVESQQRMASKICTTYVEVHLHSDWLPY